MKASTSIVFWGWGLGIILGASLVELGVGAAWVVLTGFVVTAGARIATKAGQR